MPTLVVIIKVCVSHRLFFGGGGGGGASVICCFLFCRTLRLSQFMYMNRIISHVLSHCSIGCLSFCHK